MRALSRIAAVAAAGATLYYAGLVNSIVLTHPGKPGALAVVIAIAAALALLVAALTGTGRGDAATTTRHVTWHRAVWAFVSIMALVGVGWFWDLPREKSYDWTPYHNDAIALNECAARLLVEGRDPYRDLDLFACYGRLQIGADRTTPLRRGLFADDVVYPTDDELDTAWAVRSAGQGPSDEFVWRPSYPALAIVPLVPFVLLGWDTNYLYVACLLAAMGLVLARASRGPSSSPRCSGPRRSSRSRWAEAPICCTRSPSSRRGSGATGAGALSRSASRSRRNKRPGSSWLSI